MYNYTTLHGYAFSELEDLNYKNPTTPHIKSISLKPHYPKNHFYKYRYDQPR